MNTRVSFADLLKKGAEKDKEKVNEKPKLSIVEAKDEVTPVTLPTDATPPTKRTSPTPSTPFTPSTINSLHPVSPEKDFAKVANSIVREAVRQGLFIGKSKQIYDFLYLQTRGAIQPRRSIRITKSNLMLKSDIGSERTLLKNLSHLKSIGLIKITEFDGQHGGNEYEVFLPEECHPTPPTARQARYTPQKVGALPPVESGVGGVSQIQETKRGYTDAKTSFKDIDTNDDETAFAAMEKTLSDVCKKLTGKSPTKTQKQNWNELAEILAMELEVAAARTKSISNVPAFLTEHLRRRLLRKSENAPRGEASKTKGISKSLQVGKPSEEPESSTQTYEAEPLAKEARETVLKTMREYIEKGQREFVLSLQHTYIAEDWQWLTEQISAAEKTENTERGSSETR